MTYKAVLFDLFGTLIPSPPMSEYRQMVAGVAAVLGEPYATFYSAWMSVNDSRLDGSFGSSEGDISAVAAMFGIEVSPGQMTTCMDIRRTITRKFLVPSTGAIAMLEELQGLGIQLGLVTDCVYDVPAVWPETEFAPLFSARHFSCVTHIRKPDSRAYLGVLEQLGAGVAETLFIGDGGSDELNGAGRCGIDALKITGSDSEKHAEMLRVGVTNWDGPTVADIRDVAGYVRSGGAAFGPPGS